jgi:hypothetical protein
VTPCSSTSCAPSFRARSIASTAACWASVSVTALSSETVSATGFSRRFGGGGGTTSAIARASVEAVPSAIQTARSSRGSGSRPVTSSTDFSSPPSASGSLATDSTTPSTSRAPSGTRTSEPRTTSAANCSGTA